MNWLARRVKLWWLQRRANAAILFKRPADAARAYRAMLAIEPGNDLAQLMLANLLAESGDRDGAVAELEKLTGRSPDYADAWFNLGFLHDQADQLADAERCFRRALELRPKIDRAWYGLGLVLIRQRRLEEAIDAFKEAIKLQPFAPYAYYQLGLTYHHLGRSDEAWKVHKQLAEFEPKFSATLKRDLERTTPQAIPALNSTPSPKEEKTADAH
jgi:tetratricopeptide (TPR) repeat protein